jgi:hypothetical protein
MQFTSLGIKRSTLARWTGGAAIASVCIAQAVTASPAGAWSHPAGPAGFSYAVSEGGTVKRSGVTDIAYGAKGKFNYKYAVTGSVSCSNGTFGDPNKGVRKACFVKPVVGPSGFSFVTSEYNHFTISGIADVAYGDNGKFKYKYAMSGGVDCTNEVFGNPDNGIRKACFVKPVVGPSGYTFATSEYQYFNILGTSDVAYGADGIFVYRQRVSGRVDCTNEIFGNPATGVRKACFSKPSS